MIQRLALPLAVAAVCVQPAAAFAAPSPQTIGAIKTTCADQIADLKALSERTNGRPPEEAQVEAILAGAADIAERAPTEVLLGALDEPLDSSGDNSRRIVSLVVRCVSVARLTQIKALGPDVPPARPLDARGQAILAACRGDLARTAAKLYTSKGRLSVEGLTALVESDLANDTPAELQSKMTAPPVSPASVDVASAQAYACAARFVASQKR